MLFTVEQCRIDMCQVLLCGELSRVVNNTCEKYWRYRYLWFG